MELYEVKADFVGKKENGEKIPDKTTLHTKTLIFDRETIFIGSLNLDPRSIELNSEMGLFIKSPKLAGRFVDLLIEDLAMASYQASLNEDGKLVWRHEFGETLDITNKEPQASFWRRFTNGFYRLLPIEGQL